jgi:hypothetical protein
MLAGKKFERSLKKVKNLKEQAAIVAQYNAERNQAIRNLEAAQKKRNAATNQAIRDREASRKKKD